MTLFILLFAVIVLISGVRWFLARAPKRGKRFLLQLLLIILALLTLWLALTGRLHWLFALFSSLLPFARRLLPLLIPLLRWLPVLKQQRRRHQSQQQQAGQQSEVTTNWLKMRLDHDSGTIEGEILDGPFSGRTLNQLGDDELVKLYRLCGRHDPEALKLLDAYIERHRADFHADARAGNDDEDSASAAQHSGPMSRDEAYEILGLEPGASEQQIIQAHKRMMQKVHPDRGGSNYLAAKINQAKQRLLG